MTSKTSRKLEPFGTTIFSEMTRLAQKHQAVNLSQGFPDFDGPTTILDAATRAMAAGENQYARSMGHPALVAAIATRLRDDYGIERDPLIEVAVFSGATEAIASSLLGLLNPGDDVVLFEPYYDSYPAACALAGATPRYYTLRAPEFRIEKERLDAIVTDRTRVLLLNTPHNPTGRRFDESELDVVADVCRRHDIVCVADEVYEHLTYAPARHVSIATRPGMAERTLSISSAGKTFSLTGWKIGWASGPVELIGAAQAAHQFVTFATATPFQVAIAQALTDGAHDYFETLRDEYRERRDFLVDVLDDVGFRPFVPEGTYFVLADFSDLDDRDDVAFVRRLMEEIGVAAIPPSVFYAADPDAGRRMVRFAFCKRRDTLEEAARRLRRLRR